MDCFLSASDHRCKSSFTVVALVLVLNQLSLLLIGSVVGFFKESLQEVVYAQLGNTVLPWLGCLLLLDEIGDVLCLPFVEVLFFCCRRGDPFLDGGYLQSSEKRDEFCFWIQRDHFAGTYPFTTEAGSDQPESTISPGYVAGPSRPRNVAS